MPSQPIDPLASPRYALEGKVVTMDERRTVLERGVVYIDAGQIAAVLPKSAPPPAGFADAPLIRSGGTIYPGLIELHNHLSYNILPLWTVPKPFSNRAQWRSHPEKQKLVTGPMQVLGKTADYVPAIVRYVEAKCLLGGVTTSQGFTLTGVLGGIKRYYRGLIRNVESTADKALPEASTKVDDVKAADAAAFLSSLKKRSCWLLHLSEGRDDEARKHFLALHLPTGEWAITPGLAGIHCVPLTAEDYRVMAERGGAMIWSPLSNLLLYGQTADVKAAKEAGVLMGLGADWSPSGSKNLLGEIKVAHLVSEAQGGVLSPVELLAMATINAARILKWEAALGSLEAGKRADLIVVRGRKGDPYQRLVEATESSITLVVINGVPRCGEERLMAPFGDGFEEWTVGRSKRLLNLKQETADPVVGELSLGQARDRLQYGLQHLAELARPLDEGSTPAAALARLHRTFDDPREAVAALAGLGFTPATAGAALAAAGVDLAAAEPQFSRPLVFLELDQDELEHEFLRPHLPDPTTGQATGFPAPAELLGAVDYGKLLQDVKIDLDPLTAVDDPLFFERLAVQPNLPAYVKAKLPLFYNVEPLPDDATFVRKLHPAVKAQFDSTLDLTTFMHSGGLLSLADRRLIVEQALVLLERTYVHLPLKRAMHAIEPIQRLKLLQYQLEQQTEEDLPPEMAFHHEMTDIFTSTRDLHTNYLLPQPFQDKTAFLPFMIEEYYEAGEPHYIVSKLVGKPGPDTFEKGVEVLYWNGVPIRRAIDLNAERQAGSNPAARHARGLDSLTIRPLVRVLPPDEEWVTLRYRSLQGKELEMTQRWLIFSPQTAPEGIDPDGLASGAAFLGFDLQTDAIHQVKKALFAPQAVEAAQHIATATLALAAPPKGMATTMPTVFRAHPVSAGGQNYGYVRIFTFNVNDADAFVDEFVRLAGELPQNGLIVDVRGNGGGLIHAAERLLQVLTPRHIEPQRTQFLNSPLTLEICRRNAPSPLWADFDLGPWIESIAQAVQTGATYSLGFPITPEAWCNDLGQQYYGPVVLITDALCYSATDIFAAGFQDHNIGPVLGIGGNTGAGGANVWTHSLLQVLLNDPADPYTPRPGSPFRPLPHGSSMRVAVRRTLRVGERAGVPVEDLGIVPDQPYRMTRRDLLEDNDDLIAEAGRLLAGQPAYSLQVAVDGLAAGTLSARVTSQGLSRLDLYLAGRPQGSLDVGDGQRPLSLTLPASLPAAGPLWLELRGYAGEPLVATSRTDLRPLL